jgi:hypothetical protein
MPSRASRSIPGIVPDPEIPQSDVILYTHHVLHFGAVPNDDTVDNTAAFQSALDEAFAMKGGIVYVPPGHWRIAGRLHVRRGVTLRGVWRNPRENPAAVGTVLKAYADRGHATGLPFIIVGSNATLRNVSIWYPEQDATAPQAYPPTIGDDDNATGSNDNYNPADKEIRSRCMSIQNITLYNSWHGIQHGSQRPEMFESDDNTFLNIYGTFLHRAVVIQNNWNPGNLTNFRASPRYWSDSGLPGAPSEATALSQLEEYLQQHLIAISLVNHVDDHSCYDIQVEHAHLAYYTNDRWGRLANFHFTQVQNGAWLTNISKRSNHKLSLVGGVIDVLPGKDHYGIRFESAITNDDSVHGVTVKGTPDYAVICSEAGDPDKTLSLMSCHFVNWEKNAIRVDRGNILVIGSQFGKAECPVLLESGAQHAILTGNRWAGSERVDSQATGRVLLDDAPLAIPELPPLTMSYELIPLQKPARPDLFINIEAAPYLAEEGGDFDCTAKIQQALHDAAAAGGGTVFVPAGYWRCDDTLTIPTGVHLRGTSEAPHFTDNFGSFLFSYANKGLAAGTPFITMAAGSGMVGISIYYPENYVDDIEYPWSIRGHGANLYLRNVTVCNGWQGVDLGTHRCDHYRISGLMCSSHQRGMRVSAGSTGGIHEITQYIVCPEAAEEPWLLPNMTSRNDPKYHPWTTRLPIEFGHCMNIISFQEFVFNPRPGLGQRMMRFVDDGGIPDQITLLQTHSDWGGFDFFAGGKIDWIDTTVTRREVRLWPSFTGTVNLFMASMSVIYADVTNTFIVEGGTLNLYQHSMPYLQEFPPGYQYMLITGGNVSLIGGVNTRRTDITVGPGAQSVHLDGFLFKNGVTLRDESAGKFHARHCIGLGKT